MPNSAHGLEQLEQGKSRDIVAKKVGFRSGHEVDRAVKTIDTIDALVEEGRTEEADIIRGVLNNRSVSSAEVKGGILFMTALYRFVVRVNKNCYSDNLIRFFKVHAFQGSLEAMLSFYLIQIWLVFSSNYWPHNMKDSNIKVLVFIISSFVISIFIFCFYMLIVITIFLFAVEENMSLLETYKNNLTFDHYRIIKENMTEASLIVHIFGCLSYIFTACIFSYIFTIVTGQLLIHHLFFVEGAGLIFGAIWNIQDYFADNRLNCIKIFKGFNKLENKDKAKIDLQVFKNTTAHTILSVLIFILVLSIALLMIIIIAYNPVNAEPLLSEGNIIQNAYIILFLTILVLYAKTVFTMYNKKDKRKVQIYTPITEFKQKIMFHKNCNILYKLKKILEKCFRKLIL